MSVLLTVKGLLLDMDGLLLDTERVALKCWDRAEQETGFKMPEGFYYSIIGNTMRVIRVRLQEVMHPDCDIDEFVRIADAAYHESVDTKPVPVKKGARALLEALSERHIPVCLVTSTRRGLATRKLERVDLLKYLPIRVCGDEIEHSKPAPDIYLEGAHRLGGDPSSFLALEDSENGLRSALGAGCQVAHVPDICPVSIAVQRRVQRVFRDLEAVSASIERGELQFTG